MFPRGNIRKTFTVMHFPVIEYSDTLSFALLACIILYLNGKQFRCNVFTFVQDTYNHHVHSIKSTLALLFGVDQKKQPPWCSGFALCLVNQGSQVRCLASPKMASVDPSSAPIIKYTHKS